MIKYNDVYNDIYCNYFKLFEILIQDMKNYQTHKPTLSKYDKQTIIKTKAYLKKALETLEPNICKTIIDKSDYGILYTYEEGE